MTLQVFVTVHGKRDTIKAAPLKVPDDAVVADLIELIAKANPLDGAFLVAVDKAERLKPDDKRPLLEFASNGSVIAYWGICTDVSVTVNYAGRTIDTKLPPWSPVASVKAWACPEFDIPEADAAELDPLLPDHDAPELASTQIGVLLEGTDCKLTINLTTGEREQG